MQNKHDRDNKGQWPKILGYRKVLTKGISDIPNNDVSQHLSGHRDKGAGEDIYNKKYLFSILL